MVMLDPGRLEKLEEAILRIGPMRQELHTLRERVAFLESQAEGQREQPEEKPFVLEDDSEDSSVPAPGCCEAGFAGNAVTRTSSMAVTNTQTSHELVESFWDATLFAGLDEVGLAGSLMIFFGVAVSFCLQLLFCWIVVSCFLSNDAKYDLEYLREWRVLYGHSIHFYDETSGASLVSKVCRGGPFDRRYWNNALLNEINSYLKPVFSEHFPGLTIGVTLCSMALMIWACHISTELQSVGGFAVAIYRLPRGRTHVTQHKDTRCIESISRSRLVLLTFVIAARLCIAVMLGVSGGMWLCQTRDVTNIMLNAVALLFILDIDDLLYKVLAPKHAMQYLTSLHKFSGGSRKTWAGMDLSSLIKLLVLVVTTVLFCRLSIWENAKEASDANEILCGGNRNFVYGSHRTLGPIFVADTDPYNITRAASLLRGIRPLVNDVVFNFDSDQVADYMWRTNLSSRGSVAVKHLPSVEELQVWLDKSDNEAPEETGFGSKSYGTKCKDMPWNKSYWEADWVWSTMKVLTGAKNCKEARPFCDQRELPLVRMVCPETCGCTLPDSGLFVDNGCRQKCQEEKEFQQKLNSSECKDSTEIHESKGWQRWWKGFYNANVDLWDKANVMMKFGKDGGKAGNCSFITSETWIANTFCSHSGGKRPGTIFCPVACCKITGHGDWCPTSNLSNVSCR